MNKKKISKKDKKTWDEFINNPSNIYDKDNNNSKIHNKKNRFKFDLHGLSLDKANIKVKEIILFCFDNKYKEILLITGKGIHSSNEKDIYISKDFGKLKYSVPEFIKSDQELKNLIISVNKADIKDGGEGAILIKLKSL